MTLHLVKLAVGIDSVRHLRAVQKKRLAANLDAGRGPLVEFITRNRPKRADEILASGSMYWVVKGFIRVRQRILALDPVSDREGRRACAIRFDPELVATAAVTYKPIQGWRYLEERAAPPDLTAADDFDDMPPEMRSELRSLGLI